MHAKALLPFLRSAALLALAIGGPSPALAALDIGEAAPKFVATAALGGKTFRYSLAEALAKGPVVVYFFPAADSADCSIEAHAFAEAMDQFAALGATVIGVSADDIGTLSKFSVKACQSRFPVASDEAKTVINRVWRGWSEYFRYGNSNSVFYREVGTVQRSVIGYLGRKHRRQRRPVPWRRVRG